MTSISTRVRVNTYSYVRAIAELSDGQLYGVKAYVKASGGCSAPVSTNADAAKAALGQMKFRTFPARPTIHSLKLKSCCGIRRIQDCNSTS